MASDKFRQELRQESQLWRQEGLISEELASQLSQRYRLDQLDQEASSQFLNILLGLGGLLLGLGAITFVAANWQGMSPLVKVMLLLGSLVGVNGLGFSLWNHKTSLSKQRWGHALLLLGVLLLGANIGLLPQIFHQSGPLYGLYLLWGLGVLVMAAGLRLSSLAIASLILMMMAFFNFDHYNLADPEGVLGLGEAAMVFLPLVLVCWFLPLAHWCKSQWLFALGAIALSLSIVINTFARSSGLPDWLEVSIGLFLPAALLWAYDSQAWRFSLKSISPQKQSGPRRSRHQRFRTIARSLALVALTISLYGLSFHQLWQGNGLQGSDWGRSWIQFRDGGWLWLLDEALLIILAKLGWVALLRQGIGAGSRAGSKSGLKLGWQQLRQVQPRSLNSAIVAVLITAPIILLGWVGLVGSLPVIAPFVVNILLALMAIGLIRDGLALGSRSCFWLGMVLLVLDIVTRTFEYDAGLMVKALAFALSGVAVLVAGVWFERKSPHRLAQPSP